MNNQKKALLSALVLAAIVAIAAASFATFTAQTNNPNNKFATGTLVLGNTPESSSTQCLSTGGGNTNSNSNAACATLVDLTVQKPGDTGGTGVALANVGSLTGTNFQVFMPTPGCANTDATGETYHGTANMCSAVEMYIQEYTSNTYSTATTTCLYGNGSAGACTFDPAYTLSTFASSYSSNTTGLPLPDMAPSAVRYYKIFVQLPSTAGNNLQGRQATFDLTWYMTQQP